MTPERWQQVKGVFHRARELALEERSSFLDNACSSDYSLRREVESLLCCDEEAQSAILESETTRATLVEGTKLGDYEVQSLVASGGMGVVYRARDLRLGRDVAIKVLPQLFASNRNRLRRFEQEARAAAALNHPNILAVYQLGTHEGSLYLVSELLEGETLRARVKRGAIPLAEATGYAWQIARGLRAAHEKGIVHRDLKPENLFLTKDGQIKILDFGLAKQTRSEFVETRSAALATEAGVVMGTVGYMSPEQVRGQRADFRSDIFAFGAILYEMLSGQRAFTGESSADVASAILKENSPPLSQSMLNVPRAVESIVERCLEKIPDERFQSMEELTATLREIEVPSASAVSVAHIWQRMLWRGATIVALLAVVSAAVFTYVRYFQSREATIDSIAVMPFATKGSDSSSELGDGITAGLIDSLSRIPNLRVMARSAVSHYKGQEIDPRKIGRELNVRAVLMGTLTPNGASFVLDAELVNANDDSHIWGQQYSGKATDVLTLQADLASTLSSKLRPRLAAETKGKLANPGTSSPEAYSLYVKGRYAFDQWNEGQIRKALAYFQQAVEKDPAYPQSYAGVGEAYVMLAFFRSYPYQEGIQKGKAAAERAIELDANMAEGHCALGLADYLAFEWQEAEIETRRCVELNPNLSLAHQYHSFVVSSLGRMDEGLAETRRALELDPTSYTSAMFIVHDYFCLHDCGHAIEQAVKLIEIEPNKSEAHDRLGSCYWMTYQYDKAAEQWARAWMLKGKENEAQRLRLAYAKDGGRGLLKAQIIIESDPTKPDVYDPDDVADLYSALGDRKQAFLWLDKAYEERDKVGGDLFDIKVDPFLDNIRSDPRYQALLRRMGLPQ